MEETIVPTTKSPNSIKKARRKAEKETLKLKNETEFIEIEAPVTSGKIKELSELITTSIWPLLIDIKRATFAVSNKVDQFTLKFEDLEDKVDDQQEDINVLKINSAKHQEAIEKINETNLAVAGSLKSLILTANSHQQRDRDKSIRIFNLVLPSPISAWSTAILVYDQLVSPALKLALAAGEISALPPVSCCIEMAHPLPTRGDRLAVIVKFCSRNIKNLFHRFKRGPSSDYSERHNISLKIYDDMTAINLSCLHELYNTAEVDSAWAFNGKVKCSTTEDPNKALTILNPLGSNLREMLSAPPPLFKPREHPGKDGEQRVKPPGSRQRNSEARRQSLARRAHLASTPQPAAPANPLITTSDTTLPVIEVPEGPEPEPNESA